MTLRLHLNGESFQILGNKRDANLVEDQLGKDKVEPAEKTWIWIKKLAPNKEPVFSLLNFCSVFRLAGWMRRSVTIRRRQGVAVLVFRWLRRALSVMWRRRSVSIRGRQRISVFILRRLGAFLFFVHFGYSFPM